MKISMYGFMLMVCVQVILMIMMFAFTRQVADADLMQQIKNLVNQGISDAGVDTNASAGDFSIDKAIEYVGYSFAGLTILGIVMGVLTILFVRCRGGCCAKVTIGVSGICFLVFAILWMVMGTALLAPRTLTEGEKGEDFISQGCKKYAEDPNQAIPWKVPFSEVDFKDFFKGASEFDNTYK